MTELVAFETKGGHVVGMHLRPETSDWNTANSCIVADEYELTERQWAGVAFDVGAHIGGATVALLADNPELRVVSVEALPENAAILRENVAPWADRATVIEGAAASGPDPVEIKYGTNATPFEAAHEFIGGSWAQGPSFLAKPVSLSALIGEYGIPDLIKIDCEGGEWSFLDDPAVSEVPEIRGEWHPVAGHTQSDFTKLLADFDITYQGIPEQTDPTTWMGFRAVHR